MPDDAATKKQLTTYLVFELTPEDTWKPIGAAEVTAGQPRKAIKQLTTGGGTFATVSEKAWQEHTRAVETRPVDTWS